jgi:hypothetical protein
VHWKPYGFPIANRELPDANLVRVAERHRGEVRTADSDDGKVGLGIVANELSFRLTAIGKRDPDSRRAMDHVAVRNDVAVGRDDEARAAACGRVGIARITPRPGRMRDFDIHHRRTDGLGGAGHGARVGVEQTIVGRIVRERTAAVECGAIRNQFQR